MQAEPLHARFIAGIPTTDISGATVDLIDDRQLFGESSVLKQINWHLSRASGSSVWLV